MVAGIKTEFGVTKDQLTPALRKQNEEYEKSRAAIAKVTTKWTENERAAIRALKRQETDQQKLNQTVRGLGSLLKRNLITREQAINAITRERQALAANAARQKQSLDLTGQWVGDVKSLAASYIGVSAAIGLVTSGIRDAIELEKERQDITRQSVDSSLNFALLNRGNIQQATQQVNAIGARAGFGRNEEEQRQLFDIAQSLQSALGQPEIQSRRGLQGVLEARLVGINAETAKELVLQGQAQGADDPTEFLRQALRAGQLSGRSAEEVGRNASALNFFDDKSLGFAAAAKLTDVFAEESKTFVKNAGTALTTSVNRAAIGVGADASQLEVLQALRSRGIDSESELRAVGVNEIRRIQALQVLVNNLDEVLTEREQIEGSRRDLGFVRRSREDLVREAPIFGIDEFARRQESQLRAFRSFDEAAATRRAIGTDLGSRLRQIRTPLQPGGIERNQFGFRVVDEQGRLNPLSGAAAFLNPTTAIVTGLNALAEGIQRNTEAAERAATATEQTATNTSVRPSARQPVTTPEVN